MLKVQLVVAVQARRLPAVTVEFTDELPRNATGKVLKRELRGEGQK